MEQKTFRKFSPKDLYCSWGQHSCDYQKACKEVEGGQGHILEWPQITGDEESGDAFSDLAQKKA